MTAAQAIARARAFCRRIGQPVKGPVLLSSPEEEMSIPPQDQFLLNQPPHYWQPLWQIIFPGQAFVEVSSVSGVIASYQDITPNQPQGVMVQPNGLVIISMTMRRADAIRRAKRVMTATYQPEQGLLAHAGGNLDDFSVTWTRAYDGILYNDVDDQYAENSGVVFDAHTGRVLSVNLGYLSPPATGPVARVTAAEALRIATAYAGALEANSNGWKLDDPNGNPLLRVVCLYSGPHPHSCAVWIVKFLDNPSPTTSTDDILVDSETGRVLADQHLGIGGTFGGSAKS